MCDMTVNFHNFHAAVLCLSEIFFRQINSLANYLVNALLSRFFFCQKSVRVNFRNFHIVAHQVDFFQFINSNDLTFR